MRKLMSLALALTLCVGAPAVAYAAEAPQPSDTQTEEVQVASTTPPAKSGQGTTSPRTGDPVSLVVPLALAGVALVTGGVAARKAREER